MDVVLKLSNPYSDDEENNDEDDDDKDDDGNDEDNSGNTRPKIEAFKPNKGVMEVEIDPQV